MNDADSVNCGIRQEPVMRPNSLMLLWERLGAYRRLSCRYRDGDGGYGGKAANVEIVMLLHLALNTSHSMSL